MSDASRAAAALDGGLCGSCGFSRTVESAKGSRFYLCRLSETEPSFPKYPPLPVLRCRGYKPARDEGGGVERR